MRIFCNGCSWTAGSELKDREKSRYSTLLGQMFDAEVVNIAKPGSSLQRLLRSTYERCDPTKYDIAVLQFTVPTRTEYYIDGIHPSRESSFVRVLPKVTNISGITPKGWLLEIPKEHINYMQSYYNTAYSEELSQTFEFIVFQALQDYFARHNVPVITMTLNNKSVLPFDLNLSTKEIPRVRAIGEKGHPNELGHKIIAKKVQKIIKQRLCDGSDYVDAKKHHLDRLKRDHEKVFEQNHHTDYN